MKKKSAYPFSVFRLSALVVRLGAVAVFSIAIGFVVFFSRLEGSPKVSDRSLTFEERVAYQRAIEDVYWRHRIWPKQRPDPKPRLDQVMTQSQLEQKVA